MTLAADLDHAVQQHDPDRWLASRFIDDPLARADVVLLYALNHELARVAEVVSEPLLGHMRLAWWREGIEEIAGGGGPRAHPVMDGLAEALARNAFDPAEIAALVDGRAGDLEPDPLADEAALNARLDRTAGRLASAAARRLDPSAEPSATTEAMRAWGLVGLFRNGRLPPNWTAAEVTAAVDARIEAARTPVAGLPVKAFPAVAYATLARAYARGRTPGPIAKRLRLLWASATGKI